jgi:diguanylate cyclase (GGDEF)-like protein
MEGGMAREPTHITLSVGGTSLQPPAVDSQLLMKCADRALYEAKRNGRNRVCMWNDVDLLRSEQT